MKKVANIIVEKRILIVIFMLMLTVASFFGMKKVNINSDMTKYLPYDSEMKQGIALMDRDFKDVNTMQTIKVMFKGLNAEERLKMSEELAIEKKLTDDFANHNMVYETDNETEAQIPIWIIAVALGIAFVILLLMSGSWLDPPLLMVTIGIAVVLNMGSNILLGTVSETTYSIAAILQMVLSMDYSIILMNRYRQEKQRIPDKKEAMKVALANAFSSIASSSMTTVIGLLALVFMRFKIGFDLGVVLAKGVAISMICVMVLMPFLILLMDKPLRKMEKKVWHMPTGKLASFEFRGRILLTATFIILFGAVFLGRGGTKILFSSVAADPIDDIFPKTYTTAVLYDRKDEKAVTRLTEEMKKWKNVENKIGRAHV